MFIDLHAHPGRFFLQDLPADDPAQVMLEFGGEGATSLADVVAAGMTLVFVATVSDLRGVAIDPAGGLRPRPGVSAADFYPDHRRQLAIARDAIAAAGLPLFRGAADLAGRGSGDQPFALLACEGADFVGTDVGRVAEAYEAGVRSIQPVHYYHSAMGDAQTLPVQHGGLTPLGADVIREMNALGMLVDMAHASEATTRDAVRVSTAPLMVSHTHLDGTGHDHPRLVSRAHAKLVADAGGLVGASPSGFSSRTFDDFVHEVERLVDAVGVEHVGIGTDMDGNYRPVMTRFEQFAQLRDALLARGFGPADVDAVTGGNAARLLQQVCP